jgi:hypothetical protein
MATLPPQYASDTQIFALANAAGSFARFVELTTGKQLAYAFTSVDKAKEFLRVMRSRDLLNDINRLFPCTLAEWFDWQPKKNWPDLAIDADAHAIVEHPLFVAADSSKHNIRCITRQMADGTIHSVQIVPRSDSAT